MSRNAYQKSEKNATLAQGSDKVNKILSQKFSGENLLRDKHFNEFR